jgi:hypothetical protein
MSALIFLAVVIVILAALGALSSALGADSREGIEDTHTDRWILRSY